MDINKMPKEALKDYERDLECALIRAEVDEDSERYGKIDNKLKTVRQILNADVIERDGNGNIIGYGSHADYDYYAAEVQNGQGYYDNNGHFHRREYNPED